MSKREDTYLYIKTLAELDQTTYIHYNLPQNELETYKETINWVKSISMTPKLLEPSEVKGYKIIDLLLSEINAILDYYTEIKKIYEKTSFVIKDHKTLQHLEHDLSCIEEIYIDNKAKEKLNEAIELLNEKKKEIMQYKYQDSY